MKYRLRICNVLDIIFVAININVHHLHNIKINKSLNAKLVVGIVDIIMFQK